MKFRLKKNILLKQQGQKSVIALDCEDDRLMEFSGDLASMVTVLHDHSQGRGIGTSDLQKQLALVSPSFQKNKRKRACLDQAIRLLKQMELIEDSR